MAKIKPQNTLTYYKQTPKRYAFLLTDKAMQTMYYNGIEVKTCIYIQTFMYIYIYMFPYSCHLLLASAERTAQFGL